MLAGDAHRLDRVGQDAGFEVAESAQGRDHRRRRAEKIGASGVGRVLATARVPVHDERCGDAQHYLHHEVDEGVYAVRAAAIALAV